MCCSRTYGGRRIFLSAPPSRCRELALSALQGGEGGAQREAVGGRGGPRGRRSCIPRLTPAQPSPPPGAEREFLGQRLRNLSRVTISAAGFSCGGSSGFD